MAVHAQSTDAVGPAIQRFASGIAEAPEFRIYEQADLALRQDQQAQELIGKLQAAQQHARWGAFAASDEVDSLDALRERAMAHPTVSAFLEAQGQLAGLCQEINGVLTDTLGMDFASAAAPSCCG